MSITIKNTAEIAALRRGGKILGKVLYELAAMIKPGISTADINAAADRLVRQQGAESAFYNYQGFPAAICISINEEVVHGLPSAKRVISEGDLVGLDFGVRFEGMITDAAVTVPAGKVSAGAGRLLQGTREALAAGISQGRVGNRVGDISAAIERCLRHYKLGVVKELSGHGVGHNVHEEPSIPNFGQAGKGPELLAGMTLAIEPMATLGSPEVRLLPDGWTFASADGSLAAQFEHTILITDAGPEILTL